MKAPDYLSCLIKTSEISHSNIKIMPWENKESLYILGISYTIPEGSSISHFCTALTEIHTIPITYAVRRAVLQPGTYIHTYIHSTSFHESF